MLIQQVLLFYVGVFFQQHDTRALWVKIGIAFSLVLTCLLFTLPSLYLVPQLAFLAPPYHLNPLKHNIGNHQLGQALVKQGYDPHKHFLVSDKYQTTSLLSFYGQGQQRALFS